MQGVLGLAAEGGLVAAYQAAGTMQAFTDGAFPHSSADLQGWRPEGWRS